MNNGSQVSGGFATPHYSVLSVTPEMATAWLSKNTHNRRINKGHVQRLRSDLVEGRWKFNPDPVSFDPEGTVLNGQHRLTAIVDSGVPALLAVCFNVPPDAMSVMDQGVPRKLKDIAGISNREAAVATSMLCGLDRSGKDYPSKGELATFFRRFEPEISFAISLCPTSTRGLRVAAIPAAIARAACGHIDRDTLSAFATVLMSGMPVTNTDATVIRLRDRLMSGIKFNQGAGARDVYGSVERALIAYSKGQILGKIFPAKEELFPLPDRGGE